MGWLRQYFSRRLSPGQTLIVLIVVGLIAGSAYLLYNFAAAKMQEARINAAMPSVYEAIRHQRGVILNALEAYKRQFGDYPADHLMSRTPLLVDPITNILLYELSGTVYLSRARKFQVAGLEPAEDAYVTNFFQCQRFKNCSENPEEVKHFLQKQDIAWRQLHDDPDVFVLGLNLDWVAIPSELFWQVDEKVSSWRYVSTAPTNNPGKFDLWIEVKSRQGTIVIGNWKAVE